MLLLIIAAGTYSWYSVQCSREVNVVKGHLSAQGARRTAMIISTSLRPVPHREIVRPVAELQQILMDSQNVCMAAVLLSVMIGIFCHGKKYTHYKGSYRD